jgi:dihydrofolate reductase
MGKVLMEITMSLDGYTTGPEVSAEAPFGRGGERLHEWMFAGKSAADIEAFMTDSFGGVGAVVMGRRMADLGIGPWGEEPVFHAPCFVVTHSAPTDWEFAGTAPFTFVTDGVEAAISQAREYAGDRDVDVAAGQIGGQALRLGLIDQVVMNVVPVVFGAGRPFFGAMGEGDAVTLANLSRVVQGDRVTHLLYDVEGRSR